MILHPIGYLLVIFSSVRFIVFYGLRMVEEVRGQCDQCRRSSQSEERGSVCGSRSGSGSVGRLALLLGERVQQEPRGCSERLAVGRRVRVVPERPREAID